MSTSKLLSLPGELRNQIFSYCQESFPTYPRGQSWNQWHDVLILLHETAHCPSTSPEHDRRQFLGLTQTCSVLRNEFRPLYMSQNQVYIALDQVSEYIESFLHGPLEQCHANFVIIATLVKGHRIDQMPLLQLGVQAPNVDFCFRYPRRSHGIAAPSPDEQAGLHVIEECCSPSSSIRRLLPDIVVRLEIRVSSQSDARQLHIVFNKDVHEGWMDGKTTSFQGAMLMIRSGFPSSHKLSYVAIRTRQFSNRIGMPGMPCLWQIVCSSE